MEAIGPDLRLRMATRNRVIWSTIAAMFVAVVIGCVRTDLSVGLNVLAPVLELIPVLLAIAHFYRRWRPDPWISIGAESCAQLTLILFLGALLTYLFATFGFPYRDAELHAADQWLGLDWRAYLRFVDSHPLLSTVSRFTYGSMAVQYAFTIGVLSATSRFLRIQHYVLALTIALGISIAAFTFAPAVGTYAFLEIPPSSYANLDPILTFKQMHHLEAVRHHAWTVINELEGLISFPSFHTASGLLFIWALYPIRKLRWWIVALNAALIASAPVHGAHYFIDIAGGFAVALIAVGAVSWMREGHHVQARISEPARLAEPVSAQ